MEQYGIKEKNKELIDYFESGKYLTEISDILTDAQYYLKTKINPNKNLAVIFDIDETCLSNYDILKSMRFPQERQKLLEIFHKHIKSQTPQAIAPTLDLYQYCLDNYFSIFFITGRPDIPEYIDITRNHLKQTGFTIYQNIFFNPKDQIHFNKLEQHEIIIHQGFEIVLNIGDQQRDLVGNHAKKHVKLPNPFYQLD